MQQEKIPFEFFPVLANGERRYLVFLYSLPTLMNHELDIKKSKTDLKGFPEFDNPVFRRDILELHQYRMFSSFTHVFCFVTGELKKKFDQAGIQMSFYQREVIQKQWNEKKLHRYIQSAHQKQRALFLQQPFRQRYQKIDDHLEKVLKKEENTSVIQLFHSHMKGKWKNIFERYEQGIMEPEEPMVFLKNSLPSLM